MGRKVHCAFHVGGFGAAPVRPSGYPLRGIAHGAVFKEAFVRNQRSEVSDRVDLSDRADRPRCRVLLIAVLCGAVAFSARAADDDLLVARNAVHDKLYPVAVAHAQSYLAGVQGHPAEGAEALQLLLQALAEQHQYGELLQALDRWAEVVRAAPDASAFAFWRTLGLLRMGNPRECIVVADAALTQPVSPENAEALQRLLARARLSLGDTNAALALYAEVEQRTTNSTTRAETLLEWAYALELAGRTEEALALLVRLSEMNITGPAMDAGRLSRGRLLANQQRRADAEAALRALGQNPSAEEFSRVQALVEASQLALADGRTNEAVKTARDAVGLAVHAESRKRAEFQLADLLLAQAATFDEGTNRMHAYVREFSEDPAASVARFRLAEALLRQARYEAAAVEYRGFLETIGSDHTDEAAALEGRGLALFRLGRNPEAANMFRSAHDHASNDLTRAACLYEAGDALLAAGQFRQAAETYRRVHTNYPYATQAPRALFQAADSLERAGDGEGAQATFALVVQQQGRSELAVQALLRLAALQAAHEQGNAAVDSYSQVLEATTNATFRSDALMGRGRTHYRAFHFDAASQDFAAAAVAQPALRDQVEFLRTQCLAKLGRDEDARTAAMTFINTFTNSPQLPVMVLWLAGFEYERKHLDEAEKLFREYATRWTNGVRADAAVLGIGRVAFQRADYTNTVRQMSFLQQAYPNSPWFAESRYLQGDALFRLGRFDEAVLVFNEIINRYADIDDWATRAWARKGDSLFAMGSDKPSRYQEALEAYREVRDRHDATPEMILYAEFWIGRCLQKQLKSDLSIDQYYSHVVLRYLSDRQKGIYYSETASALFVKAALLAADLLTQKKDLEQAERILNRVIQSNAPGYEEAQQRLRQLQKKS